MLQRFVPGGSETVKNVRNSDTSATLHRRSRITNADIIADIMVEAINLFEWSARSRLTNRFLDEAVNELKGFVVHGSGESDTLSFRMDLPIVCTLTTDQRRERRLNVLKPIRNAAIKTEELSKGYSYTFQPQPDLLVRLAQLVV